MKDLVEIYTSDEESFALGYIIYQSKDRLFTHLVDDQGKFDGYLLFDKSKIYKIEKDTPYLKKIEKYMGFWGNISIGDSDNEIYQSRPDFKDLIKYAKDHNKIISLATSFNYYDLSTGYVADFDDDYVNIDAISLADAKVFDNFKIPIKELISLEIESIDNFLLGYANRKS